LFYRDKKVVGVFVRFRAPLHREENLVWEIGTGYFGCRAANGKG
jgi:hypothetical protein